MATNAQSTQLKKRFLQEFARHGNVSEVCRALGLERRTVYKWKDIDEKFRAAYEQAELEATEVLETEARRRAVDGWEEPVYGLVGRGESGQIGTVRKYSDTLLIFLLKGRAPEKYRERASLEHSGKNGGPIVTASTTVDLQKLSDEELDALDRLVRKAAGDN